MLHPVGHDIVDILDKDDVGTLLVEVLDEGSVSAGAEDETSFVVAHRVVLLIDGDDVGVVLLLGERDIELDMEGLFVVAFHLGNLLAEEGSVLG